MQILFCVRKPLLPFMSIQATKPKQCLSALAGTNKMLQSAARIMKITAVLLLGACLHLHAAGFGQRVTLSEKDIAIERIFEKIQEQTDYKFLYSDHLLEHSPRINIRVKNATIQEVLEYCLRGRMLEFEIDEKTIIIRPQKYLRKNNIEQPLNEIPPIDIRGKVVDENGKPLAGVTVTVKGTKKQTITNDDGFFKFENVDDDAVLLFSSVNMNAYEINIGGQTEIIARMKTKNAELDEVQVVAYGQTTKRFQTGNVSTVRAVDIERQPINNVLLALEGQVPGLFITQNNGVPGGGITVRIQGENSLLVGNDPLYVVDGVPIEPQLPSEIGLNILATSGKANIAGNPLSYINPSDIESISVLKDADATAIYGSRAANGAILITTKKGKVGNARVELNFQQGWGQIAKPAKMLNTEQYLEMRNEAFKNDGLTPSGNPSASGAFKYAPDLMVWDTTRYTDWQKTLIGNTAHYTNVNASVSGGTTLMQYLIGTTFRRETTLFPGDFANEVGALHLSINSNSANQRFQVRFTSNYMLNNNRLPSTDLTRKAIFLEPNAPALYNSDGTLNWAPNSAGSSTWNNPIAPLSLTYKNKTHNVINNLVVSYRLFTGLELRSSFGNTFTQSELFQAQNLTAAVRPESRATTNRGAVYGVSKSNSIIVEPQINYESKIAEGKLSVLIGATIQQNNLNYQLVEGTGYSSDQIIGNMAAATSLTGYTTISKYKYNALFGRVNYIWQDKYILNLTARRDGSSRFGPKNRFHNFGSIGAAWIFTQEAFMRNKVKFLNYGKLKGSFGTTGNDQIGDYNYMSVYYPNGVEVPYQNITGLTTSLSNPYLEWEETKKLQTGIELGLFKERLLLNVTFSRNRSSNQLLGYQLPDITGTNSIIDNFPATIENTSWEFQLNSTNIKKGKFTWSTSINFTIPRNKLLEFPELETSGYVNNYVIGKPISLIKAFDYLYVDPSTGKYQFKDLHGNQTTSPNFRTDRTIFFTPYPEYYGGFQNSFVYKEFTLDFLFQFVKQIGGNYSFSGLVFPGQFVSGGSNQPISVLNRWQKPGDEKPVAKFSSTTGYFAATSSEYFYSDASYVRLKNISISYLVPSRYIEKIGLKRARLYSQAQNLFTFTNYMGDPETKSISALPPLRLITAGLQIEF
ncbi:SusC/RagA family TonB-linked outer membrane protein [Longitalea luteola]|uniref:SusC/RagA family TonB-linked outer membrane protein n=1 Tax=Longitalea luteola TaxID=2812563 RepID=UPI001A9722C0|nr:SusC/RagA family TonB-linked outer membrane protein [Longitalea luteola]